MKSFQNHFRHSAMLMRLAILFFVCLLGTMPADAKARVKHVVLIGVDGWGAYSVPKAQNIPNIKWLMKHGAWTLHKRSVMPTASAINWASMFNGGTTEEHGYDHWNSRTPTIPSACVNKDGYFPTIYSLLREQWPDAVTANLAEWDGIKYVIDSATINKVAVYDEKNEDALCDSACAYIKAAKPTFVAVCFNQLDHVGHAVGHDTPPYYAKLQQIDAQVGRLLQAIRDAGIWDDTIILMTADHGGKGKGHGNFSLEEIETPFIVCGKGVRQNYEIKDVVMQFDTAATIAECFGLTRPQCWRGLPIYAVFETE